LTGGYRDRAEALEAVGLRVGRVPCLGEDLRVLTLDGLADDERNDDGGNE
jgi:hypothetical protein